MPCGVVLRDRSLVAGDPVISLHGDFPATPIAVNDARSLLTEVLGAQPPVTRPDVLWTAQLLTSELVTNAVVHAGTDLHVGMVRDDGALLIAVADGAARPPFARRATVGRDIEESGRGMTLIAALADDFGWRLRTDTSGKIMWALLSLVDR